MLTTERTIGYDEADYEIVESFPARWSICNRCDGSGSHVNPAIDEHGLTPEELAEDPDFATDYFSGVYNEPCNDCNGTGKVLEVDRKRANPGLLAAADQVLDEQFNQDRQDRNTLYWESGGAMGSRW